MTKNIFNWLIKGIYAGIVIGIGGTCFLAIPDKTIGSFLFSIGLLTVCMYSFNLYTGKIGYVVMEKPIYLLQLLISLLGNLLGSFMLGFALNYTRFNNYIDKAKEIVNVKLSDNYLSIFILAVFCGMLMYIAVNNFKKHNGIGKYIGIIMCVMAFILCGFEHCIADMFYFSVAGVFSTKMILEMLIMILGNSIGSIIISLYDKYFL